MVNIAIVEDEQKHTEILEEYLKRYAEEHKTVFSVKTYKDGLDIIENYDSGFDIVFLDIQMKLLDGMSAAKKIRECDQSVILIFITSTVQYAVQGYQVDALGYVLKPVSYVQFVQLVDKAMGKVEQKNKKNYITFSTSDRQVKLDCSQVTYIESKRNNVIIHTRDESFLTLGPLKKYLEMLMPFGFSQCHSAYVVNLAFVFTVDRDDVVLVDDIRVPLSRARRKEFMTELTEGIL
ncbi:MAG: response regulator transcription factor [Lachnospiraceae bacterium]|nr:response regulator transcription factor [Lachnospiraceae bacterium]MBP5184463.1 response regulator transcription factor [Lachnospiraceae bacterium]